ncbi:LysR family transcriptional regulator [Marinomonas epiphytica]
MNNISWRAIRAFLLVAEYQSFTSAAEASGFSKANLSQLVTELEKSLSVQLLHRTTRQLRLTEIGAGYYQRCKRAMLELDSAAEWAMQSTDSLKGIIKMNSVGGLFGEELVAPMVLAFQKAHPEVQVHLDFSSLRVDLLDSPYDLVLRMGDLPDSSLIARKVHTVTTRYVASPSYLCQFPRIEQPEDLKRLTLIYGSVNSWVMSKNQQQRIIHIDQGIRINSGRTMTRAAIDGLGVTRVADVYCQANINKGDLVEVLPDWAEETPISLVCPPNRYQLSRVKLLMQWIRDRFDERYQGLLNGKEV